jgi:hypothetical protein
VACHNKSHLSQGLPFTIVMHTRNSPPHAPNALPPLPDALNAHWSDLDEVALIQYIADHKAEAGDSMKFKPSFWTGVAKDMLAHSEIGGPKTASRCAAKWDRVSTNLSHVICLADMSFVSSRSHTTSLLPSKLIHLDSLGVTLRASISQSKMPVRGMSMS